MLIGEYIGAAYLLLTVTVPNDEGFITVNIVTRKYGVQVTWIKSDLKKALTTANTEEYDAGSVDWSRTVKGMRPSDPLMPLKLLGLTDKDRRTLSRYLKKFSEASKAFQQA